MPFQRYLDEVQALFSTKKVGEHAFRKALLLLIEEFAPSNSAVINEPKQQACGAPDIVVRESDFPIGHIECKDIGINLDKEEKSDQMKRYRQALPNLILTDYLEFRWYLNGKLQLIASLGTKHKGKLELHAEAAPMLRELLESFIRTEAPYPADPKSLAALMAGKAQSIRFAIEQAMSGNDDGGPDLSAQYQSFRDSLIPSLNKADFADMYAQTLCYGYFAARCASDDPSAFNRDSASRLIPPTNPFLKWFFQESVRELDERIEWSVNELVLLLQRTKIEEILKNFGKRTRREDPVVHFYETFLAEYDPKKREARGVYYTPEPVVNFIVRSVDEILKRDFGIPEGLADREKQVYTDEKGIEREAHRLLILDPATGTGTFLHGVIDHIHESLSANKGMWKSYVSEHLLPRIFGFELLMAPYAVAHMKLGIQLAESGYDFKSQERVNVFLTNTLEEAERQLDLTLSRRLSEEGQQAHDVKRLKPIMVVLGNPPYSGHSENKGDWITHLLHGKDIHDDKPTGSYFDYQGKPLGERNPKWLNDDYVKFIRFAQWRIEQTGHGVLAFISNNGYIDNPTFRGMREALMETFDESYILDLHGNSKKKERAPDGSADTNVFDIMQGVAIGIFVRKPGGSDGKPRKGRVFHADLWGSRAAKYEELNRQSVSSVSWEEAKPEAPWHMFYSLDQGAAGEYLKGWLMTDAMPVNVLGFQTHRDHYAVALDRSEIEARVQELMSAGEDLQAYREKHELKDNRDWQLSAAKQALAVKGKDWRKAVTQCLYRPFDTRWCYFDEVAMDYPRRELKNHVAGKENLCLNTMRQTKALNWAQVLASDFPTPAVYLEVKDGSNCFPLYLYPNGKPAPDLFEHDNGRRPNFSKDFIEDLLARYKPWKFIPDGKGDLKKTFGPEDVFHYMYALLHSPTFRERYGEFLRIDFPRVPFTTDKKLFRKLAALGEELTGLHLMRSKGPEKLMPSFPVADGNKIEKVIYKSPTFDHDDDGKQLTQGRVYINKTQYFDGVSPEVWEFYIGGYRVAEKWLKDRKGRALSYDECDTYRTVIAALSETIRLMQASDAAIDASCGWPLT